MEVSLPLLATKPSNLEALSLTEHTGSCGSSLVPGGTGGAMSGIARKVLVRPPWGNSFGLSCESLYRCPRNPNQEYATKRKSPDQASPYQDANRTVPQQRLTEDLRANQEEKKKRAGKVYKVVISKVVVSGWCGFKLILQQC